VLERNTTQCPRVHLIEMSSSKNNNAGNRSDLLLLIMVGLPLLALAYVYLLAKLDLGQRYDVAAESVVVPVGQDAILEGERLTKIRGCFWCHGESLEGQMYFANADKGIIAVAPNLTKKIREYSPAEFARTLRNGVRPDGTSLQPAMPSFAFYNISNDDMGLMLAYMRSLPEQDGLPGQFRLLPVGWFRWVFGRLPPKVADLIDHSATRPTAALNGSLQQRGKYLAESICTECHGDNGRLRVPGTPDLTIAISYSRKEFHQLMRTGQPRHERAIDYHMVDASKYRYTELTDAEVDALYSYFQSFLNPATAGTL
jgi:mono/diheme cytochrome c family protein